jgi:hypothetical protein
LLPMSWRYGTVHSNPQGRPGGKIADFSYEITPMYSPI